jgi:hypothetical protein
MTPSHECLFMRETDGTNRQPLVHPPAPTMFEQVLSYLEQVADSQADRYWVIGQTAHRMLTFQPRSATIRLPINCRLLYVKRHRRPWEAR